MTEFQIAQARLESILRGERGQCALLGLRYVPKLMVETCDECKELLARTLNPRGYKNAPVHFNGAAYRPHNCFGMGPMCECCTWYAEHSNCSCCTLAEEDLTPKYTPHPALHNQGDRDEDYIAWFSHFNPIRYAPLPSLVDTHIAPLLLPKAVPVEYIPAWGPGPPRLEASATWLPEDLYHIQDHLPPLHESIDLYNRIAALRSLRETAYNVALNVID
jgi:hypothetical protein